LPSTQIPDPLDRPFTAPASYQLAHGLNHLFVNAQPACTQAGDLAMQQSATYLCPCATPPLPDPVHAALPAAGREPCRLVVPAATCAGLARRRLVERKAAAAAAIEPEATVHVFAARVGRWRGIFAHHSWVVVKEKNASAYTRFDVVGWGTPVRVNHREADGRWFGNMPEPVAEIRGEAAERMIPRIREAVKSYAYASARQLFGLAGAELEQLRPACAGRGAGTGAGAAADRDRQGLARCGLFAGLTPSRTGIQASLFGLAGVTLGWVEGVELNLLGLVAGLDLASPALKLPGWGRLGSELPNGQASLGSIATSLRQFVTCNASSERSHGDADHEACSEAQRRSARRWTSSAANLGARHQAARLR
jgi:hypothetical protein